MFCNIYIYIYINKKVNGGYVCVYVCIVSYKLAYLGVLFFFFAIIIIVVECVNIERRVMMDSYLSCCRNIYIFLVYF